MIEPLLTTWTRATSSSRFFMASLNVRPLCAAMQAISHLWQARHFSGNDSIMKRLISPSFRSGGFKPGERAFPAACHVEGRAAWSGQTSRGRNSGNARPHARQTAAAGTGSVTSFAPSARVPSASSSKQAARACASTAASTPTPRRTVTMRSARWRRASSCTRSRSAAHRLASCISVPCN